ncbi:MAG: ribonuclease H-like domain-containing protein [Lachnospiraceae bacterium]|nr:ribonuclease H-like domain-containing protein [Lachnospiraceae bacterium]
MITRTVELSDDRLFYDFCGSAASYLERTVCEDAPSFSPQDFLFFDIETTGLSPKEAYIYLIGCIYESENGPVMTQLFSEDPSEEEKILSAFCDLLRSHGLLIHFNGSTFDVPFVKARAGIYGIDVPLFWAGLDIYKVLKPYKELLGLKSMRMKAVEQYLGTAREDMYDGGELIEVYIKYISLKKLNRLKASHDENDFPAAFLPDEPVQPGASHRQVSVFSDYTGLRLIGDCSCNELLKILLLHNYEDVINMLSMGSLLDLAVFMSGNFVCSRFETVSSPNGSDRPAALLTISVEKAVSGLFNDRILTPARQKKGFNAVSSGGDLYNIRARIMRSDTTDELTFAIEPFEAELKLFFADYRNYYYLVNEDYAIHKSIGMFMDRERCVKCTASNCYARKSGMFLPVFEKKGGALAEKAHLYRRSLQDKAFFILADDLAADPQVLYLYVRQLLNALV